jgi:uncharacterized membrane protein YkvA (DUF1232 family)
MKLPLNTLYGWYKTALRHPKYRVWVIVGTLFYLLSPLDISPDVFPILGEIDDVAVIALLVSEASQVAMEALKKRRLATTEGSIVDTAANTVEVDAVAVKD